MKMTFFLFFVFFSHHSYAITCWDEARLKSKQDYDRIKEFHENAPKQPTDYSNTAEVDSYRKAYQEHRDKMKAMQDEAREKSRQYTDECKLSSTQKFASDQDKTNNCYADKEAKIKANLDQLTEFHKSRPTIPSDFKTREEFDAYKSAKESFKLKLEQFSNEIKAKNKAILEKPCK
jgi:hypothetical protein